MKKPVRMIPPLYLLICLLFMTLLHYICPFAKLIESGWRYFGSILMLMGLLLTVMSARLFGKLDTPVRPFEEPRLLVTQGAFSYTRNPMYVGMILFLVGFAVLLGSASPWLVIPVFVAIIQYGFIRVEEAGLETQYGHEYREYKRRVRRWI